MPTYLYRCPNCSVTSDIIKRVADIDRVEQCLACAGWMERQICAPAVRGDYPGYTCPITNKWVEGRKAHEENLARHGCRVLEPGETDACVRNRKAADEALENKIADSAAALVAAMPHRKQEALASELQRGVEASFTRQSAPIT